ncbi:protein of unknown function [Limnospira indica PCC 8005]|uniref:Uncharacterized protein n=1 Tax=Limnospira indica PCC 8005 TaxID=376219 RepID=A0A9P1KC24_9CYAN|nr:protein of unknown function [Limnospira indica PCC 8005]
METKPGASRDVPFAYWGGMTSDDNSHPPSYNRIFPERSARAIFVTSRPKQLLETIETWTGVIQPNRRYTYIDHRGILYRPNDNYWLWVPPSFSRETTEINHYGKNHRWEGEVYSITNIVHREGWEWKWFSNECGDIQWYFPKTKKRKIWIPDMKDECCGMIRRIYEFLDPESFPAEMPEKITVNAENPENRIKRINTLPEWLMYRFDIDDERWGEFEVKVEIDDVNLMTKAEEKAEIKLPNLAEAIAEIFGMVMEIAISHQVTQNAVLTALHEAGLAHAAAFKAGREVSEIIDYLGFATEEKYETIKTAFTPEADNFEELLEPNESKIKITNQKDAKETLQTTLNQIKEIFAIVRAQGTLQVNSNDPAKDILADLTRLYDSMKKQDDIREEETRKVQELLKKDFPDIKIETELIDGDNPLRGTL